MKFDGLAGSRAAGSEIRTGGLSARVTRFSQRGRERGGSALLIVIILLGWIAVMAMGNAVAIYQLRRELSLVETRQLRRDAMRMGIGDTNGLGGKGERVPLPPAIPEEKRP